MQLRLLECSVGQQGGHGSPAVAWHVVPRTPVREEEGIGVEGKGLVVPAAARYNSVGAGRQV